MNTSTLLEKRQFLARVVRTTIQAIKITGDPATDENTDLLKSHSRQTLEDGSTEERVEKLDALLAIEIDCILAGDESDEEDLARFEALFDAFLAERQPLYP